MSIQFENSNKQTLQDFEAEVHLRREPDKAFVSKDGYTLYMKILGRTVAINTGKNFSKMSDKEIESYLHARFKGPKR